MLGGKGLACVLVCALIAESFCADVILNGDCSAADASCAGLEVTCQDGPNSSRKCQCIATFCEIKGSCVSKVSTFTSVDKDCCSDTQCGFLGVGSSCVAGKCSSAGALVASLLSTLSIVFGAWFVKKM